MGETGEKGNTTCSLQGSHFYGQPRNQLRLAFNTRELRVNALSFLQQILFSLPDFLPGRLLFPLSLSKATEEQVVI